MKDVVTAVLISAILFFLSCGNALSHRYASESIHSFRLRRREYLTQVLKQISTVTSQAKASAAHIIRGGVRKLSFESGVKNYSCKNGSLSELVISEPQPILRFFKISGLFSIFNSPPPLPPPIA